MTSNHPIQIPPPLFREEAEYALAIFKSLRISDMPGKPRFGDVCDEWVFDFVRAVFGACPNEGPSAGISQIREFLLLVAKKNTKSTIAAGIMMTALIISWRTDEEHLILAPTKEVADNSFVPAAGMVRSDEELGDLFHVQPHLRTITHRVRGNTLKVVAADTDTVSGKKSGRILIDELWVFGKRSNADSMLMEATGGQVSRDEGWVIYLTTQSDEPPAGVFRDKLNYFRDVRDGVIKDSRSLPVLFEYSPEMVEAKAFEDPSTWYIPNPNIGRSVSMDWLKAEYEKRRLKKDGQFQQFLAKHLNVEIGLSLRSDRWGGADFWEAAEQTQTLEDVIARSEVITVGIDGGGLDDLLGLYVIGREKGTGQKLGWGRAWAAEIALERRLENAPLMRDLSNAGELSIVKRVGQDVAELTGIVQKIHKSKLLDRVGCDPAGIGSIVESLELAGIPKDSIVGVSQGWRLGSAIQAAGRWLADGSFVPANQALMRWCVGNARVEQRANSILITKQASGSGKIDPLMALFNAVFLMSTNPEAKKTELVFFTL